MLKVCAEPVGTGHRFHATVYLSDVRYDTDKLAVTLTCPYERLGAMVTFTEVAGFRLLDEGNLLEFWPACAADRGWLFQISENGWFAQESIRSGFLAGGALNLVEYLVVSTNDCLSVMTGATPTIDIRRL